MNKPSKNYYIFSAIIGLALGVFSLVTEYKAFSKFLSTGEIDFTLHKYNFYCASNCAFAAHSAMLLFGFMALYLGVHAGIKLLKWKP